jgi:hypothetical protein
MILAQCCCVLQMSANRMGEVAKSEQSGEFGADGIYSRVSRECAASG